MEDNKICLSMFSDNRFTFNQRNNLFNSLLTVLSKFSKDDDS